MPCPSPPSLVRSNGSRCRLVTEACIFNASVHEHGRLLRSRVRVPWNSHHQLPYDVLNRHDQPQEVADMLANTSVIDHSCAPPVAWVPVWSVNYADSIYGSALPLVDFERAGVVQANRTMLLVDTLRKHMHSKCRSNTNGPCHTPAWYRTLISLISTVSYTHDLAAACPPTAPASACRQTAPPVCFSHLFFCSLRSMFERPPPGLDMWTSAQRFVQRQRLPHAMESDGRERRHERHSTSRGHRRSILLPPPAPSASRSLVVLHVLIERRAGKGMKGRALANVDELVEQCSHDPTLSCEAHSFGKHGLAEDMRRVRWADVLVGVHGAGLANCWFMKRRSTLVEVRPYGFDGGWPDSYFKSLIRHVNPPRIFHLAIAIGSPQLCQPNKGFAITPGDAVYARACTLPWRSLRRAITLISWWRDGPQGGSTPEARYVAGAWASKNLVAYDESGD